MSGQAGNNDEDSPSETIFEEILCEHSAKYDDLFPSARIFKVPEYLRKHNRSAYTPCLIAIGPFHRKDKHLQTPMQHIKWRYTKTLILEASKNIDGDEKNYQVVLGECLKKLKGCISKAKKYYAEVGSPRKIDAEDVTLVCKGQKYSAEEVTLVYKGQKYNAEEVNVAHKARKYDSEEVTLVYKAQKDNAEEVEMVHYYDASEITPVEDDEMLEMMLVDGCFILRLLWLSYQRKELVEAAIKGHDPIDPIFDNILTSAIVQQDLVLLENQIPFFVLEHLFEVTVAKISGANKLSLEDYVRSYWEYYIKGPEDENSGSKKTSCCLPVDCVLSVGDCVLSVGHRSTKESAQAGKADQYHHILHLLHDCCLPDDHPVENNHEKLCGLEVSASDLYYAGVNFAPAENNKYPFNVKFKPPPGIRWWFHRAKFKIRTLNVDDSTETWLRNLIALEQCCPGVRPHFTSYAKFIDTLIDSDKDVVVLKKAKVILNHLGPDADVASLFNNLCKEVVAEESYFNDNYQYAKTYSEHWCPKLMAYWKRTYFASPWAFRGVIVAIITFGILLTNFIRSFL